MVSGRQESTAGPEEGLPPPLRSLGLPPHCSSAFCFCKGEGRQNASGVGTDNCSSSLRGRAESADSGLCLMHDVRKQVSFFFLRDETESHKVFTLKTNKSFHSMDCSGRMILESETHSVHTPECLSVRADPASLWQRMV